MSVVLRRCYPAVGSGMLSAMARPRIEPVLWTPPRRPARSRASTGTRPLPPVRRIDLPGLGPEDVVVDAAGQVFTGLADGRILRVLPADGSFAVVADTGGRPLGLELLPDGGLLVCDARRGLLRVDTGSGDVSVLAGGFTFCNNAAVAPDGTVYFTASSARFGVDH